MNMPNNQGGNGWGVPLDAAVMESREKQLETVLGGVVNIWGAIEGYAGQKELPGINPLMLEDS